MNAALEETALTALQKGIPLSRRPFADLAAEIGCTEDELVSYVAGLRSCGVVRRFGAVFDTRRLGYVSALCAAEVPLEKADEAAATVTPLKGVTHCYLRLVDGEDVSAPLLWFTLSTPADVFPAMCDEVKSRLAPYQVHVLKAEKRFKVDVVFGGATRARDESVADANPPVLPRERAIISALQGDTEVRADYFAAIAERTGLKEWDVLSTLEMWRRSGRLKRIALLLAHRKAGWNANGMCCWRVEGDATAAGRALAACGEVTHCYERPPIPSFPYNLYAMVHARSIESAREQFAAVSAAVESALGLAPSSVMLVSTREYKKTSMTFFENLKQ